MNTQPEALRLADWHKAMADEPKRNEAKREKHRRTEAELRRLHEASQAMLDALKWIADQTYDPWTNGAEAQRHAIAAIAKAEAE